MSLSFPNGTIINVAKVEGPPAYKEVMARLSLQSSEHLQYARLCTPPGVKIHLILSDSPPYRSLQEAFLDLPRQQARKARKKAGLPASSDVGTLAAFIQTLCSAAETRLDGRAIAGAVVTVPHLAALYGEDLQDAFEYIGLIYLAGYPYWYGNLFFETGAAYVGNGFGVCSNYTDIEGCRAERQHPPHQPRGENVLSVGFTSEMLTSTWTGQGMWFEHPDSEFLPLTADLNLGCDHRHDGRNEDVYWALVRDTLLTPLVRANMVVRRETHKVVLHGDCAGDVQFQAVVEDAMEDAARNLNASDVYAADGTYSPARGAAEMAMRVWFYYNTTGNWTT